MQKGFIICVDDQPAILGSLMIQLENVIGDACEIEAAESAEEALALIQELKQEGERIEIVITDEIMPGMAGSRFLEIVHQIDPNIMTMILTGQAGFDDVMYAVNHADLNKCIKKPWDYGELKEAVADLMEKGRVKRLNDRLSQELVAEKNKAEAIVHSITDGIIVVDGQDRISLVNNACTQILGCAEQELISKRILDVLTSKELVMLLVEASQHTDEVMSDEIVLSRPGRSPEQIAIIAIAKTLRDKNERPMGVVTILRDVTREKELIQMKADFLSTISHELRTPLTSILSTYELLLQGSLGELNEDQQEFISLSHKQGEFLSDLIDNLIDLTNLEAKKIQLATAPINLRLVASEALELLKEPALAKGLHFDVTIDPDLPVMIGDEHKISRLLKNLLSNAVKFTENGEVALSIQYADNNFHIMVADTGIGIEAQFFERIFEKFFQVDNSSTREYGGSGLGLAICHMIVGAHHGRIWVESQFHKGSTFHVILPFAPNVTN